MLTKDQKRRFEIVKHRAEDRKKRMPSIKTTADVSNENKTARELAPYVYKIIGEGK